MFKISIISFFGRCLISFLSRTLRWRAFNTEYYDSIKKSGKNVIFSFWHGRQFLLVFSHRNRGICIMTSLSKDGELQTKILKGFGYNIVRGSSSRGAVGAAREMFKKIKDGLDVAFTVDGPKGPAFDAKMGVIFLAAHSGRVIIPVATGSVKFWVLEKTWDKYRIPVPFSKAAYMYGEPIEIKKGDDLEEKRKELNASLNKVTKELDDKISRL
ncbi:MAG: lysophospholipid acyltransferase family protein [Elusimicrobiota bacterium]